MRTLKKMRKSIGWGGTTLKGMLEQSNERFKRTGFYWGVGKFTMKSKDPIQYEKTFSQIRGSLVNARETAKNISASPIVKEIGELSFALYTPEGDSLAISTGIIVHVHTMSEAIKYMIERDYEINPGIADKDIFINNDPLVGNVHNADVQTLIPLFWKGEIIGWAGGVTHEIDIGSITPGSVPVGPTNRFEDGIDLPVMKCGAQDTLFRDHVLRCEKATRAPMYWSLDEKARIAGCHMVRNIVETVIEDIGIDAYKNFMRDVIEDGRRSFLKEMQTLTVPGRYRAPAFGAHAFSGEARLPEKARKDALMHAPMEVVIKESGSFHLSFEGASSWGHHSFNCTPSGMSGAIWVILTQTIIPNDKVNDGAHFGLTYNFPMGTWLNPGNPNVSTGVAWLFLVPSFTSLFRLLGRAFQARGYVEEVISSYGGTGNGMQGGGTDHLGQESALTNFEMSCVGSGAGMVRDGLDFASAVWNPEGDMGDVEIWELLEPFLYLGRRVKANSAGPGKYRGGSGFESLRLCWNTPHYELQNINVMKIFPATGLFGGYPAASPYRLNLHDTNFAQLVREGKPYPNRDGDSADGEILRMVSAKKIRHDTHNISLPESFSQGDLYLSILNGGAGLGDPLEREPHRIADDLNGGFISEEMARKAYGAEFHKDGGLYVVDEAATRKNHLETKKEREAKSRPVREWMKDERDKIVKGAAIDTVKNMFRSSMKLSAEWKREYYEFWGLPADFEV